MSFDPESSEFGAIISWPSTLRNVVENKPNSRTTKGWCEGVDSALKLFVMNDGTNLVVDQNKIANIKDMGGENEDELQKS
jgi:hypothetical protein